MAPTTVLVAVVLVVLSAATSTTANPFNITRLLGQFPEFSTLNNYLSKTKVSADINSRQTITVLAVNNDGLGGLSGRDEDGVRDILRLHVVLDYYDLEKLNNLKKKTTTLTTLLQASGRAVGKMGFLNVTRKMGGNIVIGSAVPGSALDVKVLKAVAAKPYNISVLQVSGVIVPKGNEIAAPVPSAKTPTSSPEKASAPASPTPESSVDAPAKTPVGDAPNADAPIADAPEADAPATDAPAADAPPADAPEGASPAGSDAADAPGPSTSDESSANHVGFVGSTIGAVAPLGIAALFASF